MITPVQAIAGKTQMIRPVTFGSNKAYQNQLYTAQKGMKLNIDCCGRRELMCDGQKLNLLA